MLVPIFQLQLQLIFFAEFWFVSNGRIFKMQNSLSSINKLINLHHVTKRIMKTQNSPHTQSEICNFEKPPFFMLSSVCKRLYRWCVDHSLQWGKKSNEIIGRFTYKSECEHTLKKFNRSIRPSQHFKFVGCNLLVYVVY